MPAQWTAEIIGKMHLNGITALRLAEALGYNPKYVSAILNGHREPEHAEENFRAVLDKLSREKGEPGYGGAE